MSAATPTTQSTSQVNQASLYNPLGLDRGLLRNPNLASQIIERIHELVDDKTIRLMEVCGTHTVSIARYGIRNAMPKGLELLSGPGCPVCVTANVDIDEIIALARLDNVIMTSFGDMMRVPGSTSSLNAEKAAGHEVRVVYSPLDSLTIAQKNPDKQVIFAAVGFETTAPIIAAALEAAQALKLDNFSIYCAHKTMPHALEAIVNDPEVHVDGLILPGHVSTIIGLKAYEFLAHNYEIPGVVVGFEPIDVLQGILMLVEQVVGRRAAIENGYPRGVAYEGNITAQALIDTYFEPCDANWRGLGDIGLSGIKLKSEYARYDARERFAPQAEPTIEHKGCRCGDVLRGALMPNKCGLFGRKCTPENPIGACMVSSEGSCAAYYRYRED